jgi:hypothetical protein
VASYHTGREPQNGKNQPERKDPRITSGVLLRFWLFSISQSLMDSSLFPSWISLVLFLPLYGFLCSAGELPQDVFGKHATAELESFVHQLKQCVFAFLAYHRYVLQVVDKLAVLKIGSGLFARGPQLSDPRSEKLTLQNQTALTAALDNGDLQHAAQSPH